MSPGAPSPHSPLVLALIFSSPLLADDLFLDSEQLPQVLTATRLKQSPAAVPGSMTVIDSALMAVVNIITRRPADSHGTCMKVTRGQGWDSALFYYGDDALNGYRFERVDARIAKRIALGKASLELAGVLQQRLDNQPTTFIDNRYDQSHVMYFSAELGL